MKKVFVTGGAGYIGSITTSLLKKEGFQPMVFDNLEIGHREAVDCPFFQGDLRNIDQVREALEKDSFEAVIHFAAHTEAGLSAKDPQRFFDNNVLGMLNLLKVAREKDIKHIVFSSSSEVYGEGQYFPLDEKHPLQPTNPYGLSKLMGEQILQWYSSAYQINSVSLRYFNAAGALTDGSKGDGKEPSTLLISNAIKGALGYQEFKLTYSKVDTPDGSTIRDYVHVLDLARGHLLALDYLEKGGETDSFNLGTGKGYSTLEVVNQVKELTGVEFPSQESPQRRANEPAAKYASYEKAKDKLGWEPQFGLKEIIESAHKWHQSHPHGYA